MKQKSASLPQTPFGLVSSLGIWRNFDLIDGRANLVLRRLRKKDGEALFISSVFGGKPPEFPTFKCYRASAPELALGALPTS